MFESWSIGIASTKELPDINSLSLQLSTKLVVATAAEQIDEYGFIIMSKEAILSRLRRMARERYYCGGSAIGREQGAPCKDLCRYLKHRKTGRTISFAKTGEYWCSRCECVMRCHRCRCCGRVGRSKPHRPTKRLNHPDTKFIE